MGSSTAAAEPSSGSVALLKLVARYNLQPELDMHPSWLPADWPARHRSIARLGPAGRAVLADLLRREGGCDAKGQYDFDAPLRRVVLLDAASLRRLAGYCGLCAHQPMFKLRGVGAQLRRLARRLDTDAARFVTERTPVLSEIRMSARRLEERPLSVSRVVMERGYRLLLAAMAGQGDALYARLKRKLPRRVSVLSVPALDARQVDQLGELMLLCIVPERLAPWDWLF